MSTRHPTEVIERVSEVFGVPEEDILGPSREPEESWPRHVAWYVLRMQGWKLTAIGAAFGRDHTTVHHGIRRVERRIRAEAVERARVLDVMGVFDAASEAGMLRMVLAEREHAREVLARLDALIDRMETRAYGRRRTLAS